MSVRSSKILQTMRRSRDGWLSIMAVLTRHAPLPNRSVVAAYIRAVTSATVLAVILLCGRLLRLLYIVPVKYIKTVPMRASYLLFLLLLGTVFYAQSLAVMRPYQWIFG